MRRRREIPKRKKLVRHTFLNGWRPSYFFIKLEIPLRVYGWYFFSRTTNLPQVEREWCTVYLLDDVSIASASNLYRYMLSTKTDFYGRNSTYFTLWFSWFISTDIVIYTENNCVDETQLSLCLNPHMALKKKNYLEISNSDEMIILLFFASSYLLPWLNL